jgi:hypothetical protein
VDLAKFVGAASAPVALIISASIFLSNLTAKYVPMFSQLRTLTEETRSDPEHPDRAASLQEQIGIYEIRIRWILHAVQSLTLSIISFISTVAFTSISMFFPDQPIYIGVTIMSMFAGLILLAVAVIIEMWENHLAKGMLGSELGRGTPNFRR